MRTVHIDFTKSPVEISNMTLGKQGEHNATELKIIPPAEMSENEKIISYAVAFQIGTYKKFYSLTVEKAETIIVPIERQVTNVNYLSIQLEGYDGNENMLIKSERLDGFIFEPSVTGDEIQKDISSGFAEQVAANTSFRKKFSENESGELTYNGETIGGNASAAMKTANVPSGMFTILPRDYGDEFVLYDFPDDAEIHTVRFLYNQQWIDIRNLHMIDGIPYTLNMGKSYVKQDEGVIAVAFIGYQTIIISGEATTLRSFIAEAIESFEVSEIEIDYYENTKG